MLTPSWTTSKNGEKSSVFVIQLQSVLWEYVSFNFANIPLNASKNAAKEDSMGSVCLLMQSHNAS